MWRTAYRVAILTASDRGAAGERVDESGPLIRARLEAEGARVVAEALLPDDGDCLAARMREWCDARIADVLLTTGGTGLSPRDQMPEATQSIAERTVPGIAEGLRAHSLRITPRAMLSRGVAAVRGRTLIVNLPGSPKAVGECLDVLLPVLEHGLDMLCGNDSECARAIGETPCAPPR